MIGNEGMLELMTAGYVPNVQLFNQIFRFLSYSKALDFKFFQIICGKLKTMKHSYVQLTLIELMTAAGVLVMYQNFSFLIKFFDF